MLETKDLVKVYKPKKGVPVTALDHVSIKFPDTGMIFLLGKSGSGKSTLLNVLGGLDRYDAGEILIKGKSSKSFRQCDFDSYRNTYVGFIFQEYNILDAFSVGANIALALQLQGIKPTDERINGILAEVDLEGFGSRKPNELSGGQKQRVAIARALVKDPKIIMADEPTGALDSNTGRQVLATLKKLSADRLVIVVSHDREFAEQYADRVIELADGRVVRDVERGGDGPSGEARAPVYEADTVSLSRGYQLTEEDRDAIFAYIQRMVTEGKAPKIALQSDAGARGFRPTDTAGIRSSGDGYHLIKSKLPMKHAFKMGASGLKHKKFRLVMTILLSCVAFVMFGMADTMASYDYVTTSVSSLSEPDSQITYAALEKMVGKQDISDGDYYFDDYARLTDADFARFRQKTGLSAYPVLSAAGQWQMGISMDMRFSGSVAVQEDPQWQQRLESGYYAQAFAGYVEVTDSLLADLNAKLVVGTLPQPGTNQLAISTFILETFREFGYAGDSGSAVAIRTAADMLGRKLTLDGLEYTVTGVVDPGIDYSRYDSLKEPLKDNAEFSDQMLRMAMQQELRYSLNYSLSGLAMVAQGQIQNIHRNLLAKRDFGNNFHIFAESGNFDNFAIYSGTYTSLTGADASGIVWLDGVPRTQMKEGEVVLSETTYRRAWEGSGLSGVELDFRAQYTSENPDYTAISGLRLYLDHWITEMYESIPARIVGIIPDEAEAAHPDIILSDALLDRVQPDEGPMTCQAIAAMPKDAAAIRSLVELSDTEFTEEDGCLCRYDLMNPVSFELKMLDEVFEVLRKVFVGVGIAFVIFASLLFSNFIATSISYKKREIGILRAIGSRSNDVFRIFFAESFLIAMINFLLSLGGTIAACALLNNLLRYEVGLLLTVLNVGFRQVALLFGICLLVAAAASFLPVRRIAAKRPIDAIRDR